MSSIKTVCTVTKPTSKGPTGTSWSWSIPPSPLRPWPRRASVMVPVTEVATGLAAPLPLPPSVEHAGQRVLDAEEQRCWNHSVANVLV